MAAVVNQYEWLFDVVEFGVDVREFRNKKEWTQQTFANWVGVKDGSYVSMVECGRTNSGMSMAIFLKFCAVMDVDPRKYFSIQQA